MRDAFGTLQIGQDFTMADYLDQSSFDEKFEIDPAADTIRNIYHVRNKYYVPVMAGSFAQMYDYATKHMIHPEDASFNEMMDPRNLEARLAEGDGTVRAECRERLVDGTYRWVQYLGITGAENGVPEGKVWFYVFDVQVQKDRLDGKVSCTPSQEALDELTGLHQRSVFVQGAKRITSQQPGPWCCIAIDVQNFKVFNSWFGREKGDYLLSRIGSELQEFERREGAFCAYFGRDNFAAFLQHRPRVVEELFDAIKEIVSTYSNAAGFTPAFGVDLVEEASDVDMETYDRARVGVAQAKKSYVNRIVYFDRKAYERKRDKYVFIAEFRQALRNNEITFSLQPQCHTATGKVVGLEALARWVKPDGQVVSPGSFVPLLEDSGFITELDKCVWEAVCLWLRDLMERNITPVPVSINVSQVDLLSMDVAAYLYGLANRHNVPARLLNVEITESAYAANMETVQRVIDGLKDKGFRVFLDDFGAGYSSLSMLDQVNVDTLKLDMAFMRKESGLNKKGISIIESIVSMTKALGLPVIVEGVENAEQETFLKNMGCKYAQGFHYYRPLSIEKAEELLLQRDNLDLKGFEGRSTELFHAREFLNENLFTDSMLNNIIGAVAFYSYDGKNLTIDRFNEQFHRAIGDPLMETRQINIQNYVVSEDVPALYHALERASEDVANGGKCEVRFYKSDESVFWFRMQFYYLRSENGRRIFCGQVEDITETREQSLRFFEVLREASDVSLRLNLDQETAQYALGDSTLFQVDLPTMALQESIGRTIAACIEDEKDQQAFARFFDADRLRAAFRRAVYHETLEVRFKINGHIAPTEFNTYILRYSKDQDLIVYIFAKEKK